MPVTVLTRVPANTAVGKLLTSVSFGASEYAAYVTDAKLSFETEEKDARTLADTNAFPRAGRQSASLDVTRRTVGPLPIMITAMSNAPVFAAAFRNTNTGESYTGNFLITSARFSSNGTEFQSEQITAVSQGPVVSSTPAIVPLETLPTRVDQAASVIGNQLAKLVVGTVNDFINVYTDLTVSVSIDTYDGAASLDVWKYPIPKSRKITISASRLIQASTTGTPTAANLWTGMALTPNTVVPVVIQNAAGGTIFTADGTTDGGTGYALVTRADVSVGDDTQKETIELVIQGAMLAA